LQVEPVPFIEWLDAEKFEQAEELVDAVLPVEEVSDASSSAAEPRTHIGVPVKHQRNFPVSAQHATAFLVLRFLMLCASSIAQSARSLCVKKKTLPRTILHHFTSNTAEAFGFAFPFGAEALPFFAATVRPKCSASLSDSESELITTVDFALAAADLISSFAVGSNAACSERMVSYVVTTMWARRRTAAPKDSRSALYRREL
jgi:hypothetical protein